MSKAEELAKKLGKEIVRTVAHDVLMHDALTHLRALEASHQRLKNELENLHALVWGECPSLLNEDSGGNSAQDMEIRAALEQARGLL